MADALRAGVPAITLTGMGPGGETPYWHQVQDTYDKIDPQVLERAYAFTWAFIQALDARAGVGSGFRPPHPNTLRRGLDVVVEPE